MMQKAVITGAGQPLSVIDAEIPGVPSAGALIKVYYTGVCHSELHQIDDENHKFRNITGKASILSFFLS